MPTKRSYEKVEGTVEGFVSDFNQDKEDLKQEIQDWYDNLPENFQNGSKGEALQEVIDALEQIEEIDPPEKGADLKCEVMLVKPRSKRQPLSRNDQLSNAASKLEAAASALEEEFGEAEDWDEQYVEHLRDVATECYDISFPGMRG